MVLSIASHLSFVFSSGFVVKFATITFRLRITTIYSGLIPYFVHDDYTAFDYDSLRFFLCVKTSDVDVVTFASDLRAPFMVISPEFAKVNIIISVPIKRSPICDDCTFPSIPIRSSLF